MFKKLFGVLQRVGKALMLPVAILPAAGLLLGIGNMLVNPDFLQYVPALENDVVQAIANVLMNSGQIVFDNLSLLFAVGVAIGLSGGEGVAGLAAIIGFLVMNVTMGTVIGVNDYVLSQGDFSYASVLGIPTLQTGYLEVYSSVYWHRPCTNDSSKSNFHPTWVSSQVNVSFRS